jgi:outer membrane protein
MKLTQELEQHRANLTKRIQDTVFNYIKEWNKTAGYDFILNNLSLIYAKPGANKTAEILDLLNKRYDETHNKSEK